MTLNDRSNLVSYLGTRRSGRPRELVGPGPTPAQLEQILTIGARTPDHGTLFPWRFVTIGDHQRSAFARLLAAALAEEEPDALPAKFAKAEQFAHSGAALIVLISAAVAEHKIREWEQILSCGAAGMNILHAAHALGFVGGWHAYSGKVRTAFCGPGERIAGFIFIGTPAGELEERPRPPLATVWKPWQPPKS